MYIVENYPFTIPEKLRAGPENTLMAGVVLFNAYKYAGQINKYGF
jgi:hypothetical protein